MSLIIGNNSSNLDDANGNLMGTTSAMISTRNNNDEDSTSEYTDPENSAPTELLAEFLTSIMRKDYVNALKYCKMILEFEPNNKTAKDFYPELIQKVSERQQGSSSDQSDENCNYTSSLELVEDIDNEILDNNMIDDDSSSVTSSNSTSNGSMDLNSYSDEDAMNQQPDQEDLINQFSYSSNNSSKSDPFPESMSSSESIDHRFSANYSPSFSFTSLLLEESDDVNNNEKSVSPVQQQQQQPHSSSQMNPSSSPFTSKIVNMIRRKLN
ncbi:unnamed protein product [Chironomus riparius]|uniref:Uncharacterized protein n=1 Tax=Chironomus riparius TaxID=315576 RepID=A0A9N9RPW8_9DIPT|nr:unnamed protein product [Chironomus riparius]